MSEPSNVRGLRARKTGDPVVALFTYVPPDVAHAARVRAASDGITLSALVAEGLRSVLNLERGPDPQVV